MKYLLKVDHNVKDQEEQEIVKNEKLDILFTLLKEEAIDTKLFEK